jgi:putative chitinase
MRLSLNFSLNEFTESDTAVRLGILNIPSALIVENLTLLARGLEAVRELLKTPIFITSGYRCLKLNRAINSKDTSAHVLGYAADFKSPAFASPKKITAAIKNSGIKYDQLICEGNWVHISFDPRMRQQTLRALFDRKGNATYKEFV